MYGTDAPTSKQDFVPDKFHSATTLKADIKAGAVPLEFPVTSQ